MREQEWTCHACRVCTAKRTGQECVREQEWTCHAGCVLLEGLGRGVCEGRNMVGMQGVYVLLM